MQEATSSSRLAHISFDAKAGEREVRVAHPGKLTPDEIARIDKVLINDVIHHLTGCACLSGTVKVIWEKQFAEVIQVRLA